MIVTDSLGKNPMLHSAGSKFGAQSPDTVTLTHIKHPLLPSHGDGDGSGSGRTGSWDASTAVCSRRERTRKVGGRIGESGRFDREAWTHR
jgi:hypothetical protein